MLRLPESAQTMEELRLSAVATRVVAWHNRHPLARRITASQVHGIGYVALPFSDPSGQAGAPAPAAEPVAAEEPAGGTLRQRAQARARQQDAAAPAGVPTVNQLAVDPAQLAPDFSEDFIDPLSPRAVARFARRHGQALVRAPADGPLRRVRADGRQGDGGGLTLYLLTAVVETGTFKSRVLVGPGDKPAVLGRRVLSTPRVAALLLPLVAGAVGLYQATHKAPAAAVARAGAAASAPHAAASAPAFAAASGPLMAAASAAARPASAAPADAPAYSASAPIDVEPRLGRIDMPSLRPHLGGRPPSPPQPASAAVPAPAAPAAVARAQPAAAPAAPSPVPVVARAVPPGAPAFALSTRLLRTRAEADQVRVAMKSLLRATSMKAVRVEVIAEGDDWRVVGMPFETREEADKARELLVSRGMRVQVLAF